MNVCTARVATLMFAVFCADAARAETPATTQPDADMKLVRDAIVKSMPKVKAADVTAEKTIESLGGNDIQVMMILGEIGEQLGTPVDDDAVERATNANPAKTMRGLTVKQLSNLTKDARAAK